MLLLGESDQEKQPRLHHHVAVKSQDNLILVNILQNKHQYIGQAISSIRIVSCKRCHAKTRGNNCRHEEIKPMRSFKK